jgi:hypothetical protein
MATHGFLSLLQWPSSRPNAEADERVGADGNRAPEMAVRRRSSALSVAPTSIRRNTITTGGGRSRRRPKPKPAQAADPLDHREIAGPVRRTQGGKSRRSGWRRAHVRGRSDELQADRIVGKAQAEPSRSQ